MTKIDFSLMEEEEAIIILLSEAYEKFTWLPHINSNDLFEFGLAIHAAQNIVMARPVAEKNTWKPNMSRCSEMRTPYSRKMNE